MNGFHIQKRSIQYDIWFEPRDRYDVEGPTRSTSVDALRETIRLTADRATLSFKQHYRIVTDQGAPVERYAVSPGLAKLSRLKS